MVDTIAGNLFGFYTPGWTLFVVDDMVCTVVQEELAFGVAGGCGYDFGADRFSELFSVRDTA